MATPQLSKALMDAAMAGGFTVGAAYALKMLKLGPELPGAKDDYLEYFLLGASGSLLQQYVGPLLGRL